GQHGQARSLPDLAQEVEIGAAEHPVALDRGAQDPRHARFDATSRDLHGVETCVLEPPMRRDTPTANVDRHDEPVTEPGDEWLEGFRLRNGRGADDDTRGARG